MSECYIIVRLLVVAEALAPQASVRLWEAVDEVLHVGLQTSHLGCLPSSTLHNLTLCTETKLSTCQSKPLCFIFLSVKTVGPTFSVSTDCGVFPLFPLAFAQCSLFFFPLEAWKLNAELP